jgi:hypothetical protein
LFFGEAKRQAVCHPVLDGTSARGTLERSEGDDSGGHFTGGTTAI